MQRAPLESEPLRPGLRPQPRPLLAHLLLFVPARRTGVLGSGTRLMRESMIIIRSGIGIVVVIVGVVFPLLMQQLVDLLTHDPSYYQTHGWPKLAAFSLAGAAVYLLARSREGRRDTLFFIPMGYWAIVLFVTGIPLALMSNTRSNSGKVHARAAGAPGNLTTSADIQAAAASAPAAPAAKRAPGELRLQGIFYRAHGSSTAIINSTTVAVGDIVDGYAVKAIEAESVILRRGVGGERVLKQSEIGR